MTAWIVGRIHQVIQIANLKVKSFLDYRLSLFALGRTSSFTWFRWFFYLFGWFLPTNNGCRVTTDISDQITSKVVFH